MFKKKNVENKGRSTIATPRNQTNGLNESDTRTPTCSGLSLEERRESVAYGRIKHAINTPAVITFGIIPTQVSKLSAHKRQRLTPRQRATMPIIVEMIRSNPSVAFPARVKRQQTTIRLTLKIGNADTKPPIPGIKVDTHF